MDFRKFFLRRSSSRSRRRWRRHARCAAREGERPVSGNCASFADSSPHLFVNCPPTRWANSGQKHLAQLLFCAQEAELKRQKELLAEQMAAELIAQEDEDKKKKAGKKKKSGRGSFCGVECDEIHRDSNVVPGGEMVPLDSPFLHEKFPQVTSSAFVK